MKCKQQDCGEDAKFMVYWASNRVPSCEAHANKFRAMADAMGMSGLQVNLIVAPDIETPVIHTQGGTDDNQNSS